ncbi:hypothetical protein GN244_ATG09635 [Phytophthora infestans]|uniref:Uncharacterized protein n=1 Tax=Phytophthora infestans TaxID=4787 RepID=A0A833T7J8_PHYIN|nr:hypothetical protein GN244_ATG09635 [Phytophthora infestans]
MRTDATVEYLALEAKGQPERDILRERQLDIQERQLALEEQRLKRGRKKTVALMAMMTALIGF